MMNEHEWAILGQGILFLLAAVGVGAIGFCVGKALDR